MYSQCLANRFLGFVLFKCLHSFLLCFSAEDFNEQLRMAMELSKEEAPSDPTRCVNGSEMTFKEYYASCGENMYESVAQLQFDALPDAPTVVAVPEHLRVTQGVSQISLPDFPGAGTPYGFTFDSSLCVSDVEAGTWAGVNW